MFKLIRFAQGAITNQAGKREEIIVSSFAPNYLKDILIGGGLMLSGICWIAATAFRKGSHEYEVAEYETLKKLDIVTEDEEDCFATDEPVGRTLGE